MKKKGIVFCLIMMFLVAGCSKKFDPVAYTQGFLDAAYKNDPSTLKKTMDVSESELEEVHAIILEAYVNSFENDLVLEDIGGDVSDMMDSLLSHLKYSVKDAKKVGNDYDVTISYMPLIVFEGYDDALDVVIDEYLVKYPEFESMGEEDPAYEGHVSNMLFEAMKKTVDEYAYGEEETYTLKLVSEDGGYYVDTDGLLELDEKLVDWSNYDNN